MMDREQSQASGPLTTVRIIWGAILMGLLTITGVMVLVSSGSSAEEVPADGAEVGLPLVTLVSAGVLLIAVPVAYFVRNQVYKQHWAGDAVGPDGYVTGNIIFLAFLEAPGVISAIAVVIHGGVFPHVLPMIVAAGIILANFPTGGPMDPAEPRLGVSEK